MDALRIQLKLSSAEKYPAKQHVQRVARELGASEGLIYLIGQYAATTEDSDAEKTWKQRRYFYYCSGVDIPNCCLTYDIKTDVLELYIPEIDPERVVWVGRPPTIGEAEERYDVDLVSHNSELFGLIRRWRDSHPGSLIYILHEDHKPDIEDLNLNSEKLLPAMDRCRAIKDEYEIACIRTANRISALAHKAVLTNMKALKNEAQIQAIFEATCTMEGNAKQAYPPIAGSGKNAGTLHYSANNEPLKDRELVCLDAGAQYKNYASDVTRSFPISGYFTQAAEEIYALVELMQESSIKMLRPGMKMIDLHHHCHRLLTQGFLKLGIFHNGSEDEIIEAGTSKGFLPHGLGHHLGLETHDIIGFPILRYKLDSGVHASQHQNNLMSRSEQPKLEAGMVITIEPGIYFSRYELNRAYLHTDPHQKFINQKILDKYWSVGGVRIEDDILITPHGYENLTTAPKGTKALEIIRKSHKCKPFIGDA